MENMIFDDENFEIRKKIQKNKAKTNKIKLCMHRKSGSNLFVVYTHASVCHVFSIQYSEYTVFSALYMHEWNQNFIIALSYVLYVSPKITEFEV